MSLLNILCPCVFRNSGRRAESSQSVENRQQQGEFNFPSLKEMFRNTTQINNIAMNLKQEGHCTVATSQNNYEVRIETNGEISATRKRKPGFWVNIKRIFSALLFVNYELRKATLNIKLTKEVQRLQFEDKRKTAVADIETKRFTTEEMCSSVSNYFPAKLMMESLETLFNSITSRIIGRMKFEKNEKELDNLRNAHTVLNAMLQSVLQAYLDEKNDAKPKYDAALQRLFLAVNDYGDTLETTSGALAILDDLCKKLINEHTSPYMAFASLEGFYVWATGSGYSNPCVTAILQYTSRGEKAWAADALRENSALREAVIAELNNLYGDRLLAGSTVEEITGFWVLCPVQIKR